MPEKTDAALSQTSPQKVALLIGRAGWSIFWLQLVLAVVSGAILFFYAAFSRNARSGAGFLGVGLGTLFAICGLVTLAVSIYLAFRYTRFAARLQAAVESNRPSKTETLKLVRLALSVNLLGLMFTILGAQAIIGSVLAIALSQPEGWILRSAAVPIVQPLDLFVVQSNINAVTAYFFGIAISFWLFNRLR
jgi:Protein of unknown function (DUF3611)